MYHFTKNPYRAIRESSPLTCSDSSEVLWTIARSSFREYPWKKRRFFRWVFSHRCLVVKSSIIRLDFPADGSLEIIPEIRAEIPWRCNREKLEGELRNSARNEVQFLSHRSAGWIAAPSFSISVSPPPPPLVTAKASGLSRTVTVSQAYPPANDRRINGETYVIPYYRSRSRMRARSRNAIRNTSPMVAAISTGRDVYATKSEGTLTFQLLCAALVLVRHSTARHVRPSSVATPERTE